MHTTCTYIFLYNKAHTLYLLELALQELLFGSINQQNTSTTKRKSKDDKAKEKEKQISLKVLHNKKVARTHLILITII